MTKIDKQSLDRLALEMEDLFMEQRHEQEKRSRNIMGLGVWAMILLAIFTLAFVFFTISTNNKNIRLLENEIEILSETISLQDISITGITEQINESPQSVDLNINKIVEKLDSDFKKLQEIIVGNPTNIIEFALLIKEVDSLKESYKDHKDSVYKEMERNFGLFRWFIYMNLVIALAILGIAVSVYSQTRQDKKDKEAIKASLSTTEEPVEEEKKT